MEGWAPFAGGQKRPLPQRGPRSHRRGARQDGRPRSCCAGCCSAVWPASLRARTAIAWSKTSTSSNFALGDDEMVAIAALDTGRSAFFDHHDPATIEWMSGLIAQRVDEGGQTALITYWEELPPELIPYDCPVRNWPRRGGHGPDRSTPRWVPPGRDSDARLRRVQSNQTGVYNHVVDKLTSAGKRVVDSGGIIPDH